MLVIANQHLNRNQVKGSFLSQFLTGDRFNSPLSRHSFNKFAPTENFTIFCDGLSKSKNTDRYACWGIVIVDDHGLVITSDGDYMGSGPDMTNNLAEYYAVLHALCWTAEHVPNAAVEVKTDSQLVAEQVNGKYACKDEKLLPLCYEARELLRHTMARLTWIPREQNKLCYTYTQLMYQQTITNKQVCLS